MCSLMYVPKIIAHVQKDIRQNLQARDIRVSEVDFNSEFIARIIPKLDWTVLWKAAESVNLSSNMSIEMLQCYKVFLIMILH